MPIFPIYKDSQKDIKALMPNGGNIAEAALYQRLKEQLPANWYVVHNIHFHGDGDNQIDFLIIANGTSKYPNAKGIVNLECKGKSYQIDSNGTFWLNNTPHNPYSQSKGAVTNLYNSLKQDVFNGKSFCVYANAVVFPTKKITEEDRKKLANIVGWIFDEEDCKDICGINTAIYPHYRSTLSRKKTSRASTVLFNYK